MIGKTISHYKILDKLGEGGRGIVYKAEDTKLKRTIALKFLPPEFSRDEAAKERFIREAQAASALDHSNICTIYEIDETEDGQLFIAMGYYEGETLNQKIERGPLKIDDAIEIAKQIADGLSTAHEKGIVHRDIKPANIMINVQGDVKILDFGLAKLAGQTKLTVTGSTLGTVAYMSPEQAQGQAADHRTDIWSLGVMLYEMIAGQRPFQGEYDQVMLYKIVSEQPEPLTGLRTGVPMGLERIVTKALAKNHDERFQHVDDMIVDLRRLGISSEKVYPQPPFPKRNFHKMVLAGVFLSILISLTIGYFTIFYHPKEQVERISIVVADFVNETKEEELDGLSGMLITELDQSRRLSVVTRTRMFDILKQMGKQDVSRVDETLGREMCKQADVGALAIASIRKFGKLYTIDLKIIDVEKNEYLFTTREQGEGQESILAMIDELSNRTRKGLKEKSDAILQTSQKVAEVMTSDFEAYKHYFNGVTLINKLRGSEARKEFEKAIELDSTFGLAYYQLANVISGKHMKQELLQKAYSLSDRIPERERYLVRAQKAALEKGGDTAIEILKEMEKIYPNDKEMLFQIGRRSVNFGHFAVAADYLEKVLKLDPLFERALQYLISSYRYMGDTKKALETTERFKTINPEAGTLNLAVLYALQGDYINAIENYNKVLEINSGSARAYEGLISIYRHIKRYDEMLQIAKRYALEARSPNFVNIAYAYATGGDFTGGSETLQMALELRPEYAASITLAIADLYMFNEQYEKAEAVLMSFAKAPQSRQYIRDANDELYRLYLYLGKYREALELCDKLIELNAKAGLITDMARIHIRKSLIHIWGWNNINSALKEAEKTFEFQNRIGSIYWHHLFYYHVFHGDYELAEKIRTEKFMGAYAKDIHLSVLYSVRGECTEAAAIADTVLNVQRPRGLRGLLFRGAYGIIMLYQLAYCQFKSGQLDKAIENLLMLQKTYSNNFGYRGAYFPKSFYLMGKIYEQKGDKINAIKNYEKLLELWKNADEDLVDLEKARKRYELLKMEHL